MEMKRVYNKVFYIVVLLLGVSVVTFTLTYLAGSNPALAMFEAQGVVPTEEQLLLAEKNMGIDKPIYIQYMNWGMNVLKGDLGISFLKNEPVINLIIDRLAPTAYLTVISLLIMLIVAIPTGIYSAINNNKVADYIIRVTSFIGISIPSFCLGVFLLYFFTIWLDILPVIHTKMSFSRIILPAITLAVPMAAKYSRQVRIAILEELKQDYVIGAVSRGVKKSNVLLKYILPNAILPLLAILGISIGSLLGGAAVVEIIFSYPGLGSLMVEAVNARDYPLIQGLILWISGVYLILNQLIDELYYRIDPRTRKVRL